MQVTEPAEAVQADPERQALRSFVTATRGNLQRQLQAVAVLERLTNRQGQHTARPEQLQAAQFQQTQAEMLGYLDSLRRSIWEILSIDV